MHSRIVFGLVAWLLGAATATAGSLLAVSLLGQGITGNQGQLLTQDAVNRALASEGAQGPAPAAPSVSASQAPSPAPTAATPTPVATSASPTATAAATATATTAPPPVSSPSAASSPSSSAPASLGGAVLTSAGGEVVATCQAAGAYLNSWSPHQGYQVGDVIRGPAATARVTFESHANRVIMVVSCSAGVPSATSRTWIGDE